MIIIIIIIITSDDITKYKSKGHIIVYSYTYPDTVLVKLDCT